MEKRNFLQLILISLRGIAMGAADVVPGVSGGTIAFISGIYQELIESINNINVSALRLWRKKGFKSFWLHINGTFFMFLFGGIGLSVITLSKIVTGLLAEHPIMVWSFFFGLIVASVWLIGKQIKSWNWKTILPMLISVAVAYYITTIQTVGSVDGQWFILLSGAIAICAMILPGISGSFILVLLGSYETILGALSKLTSDEFSQEHLMTIGFFAIGCIIGLFSFARILKYLFHNYEGITIAALTGFMIGSLNKVWPWKSTIRTIEFENKAVEIQENILPSAFEGDNLLVWAVLCALVGFSVIVVLERFAPKNS